MEIKIEEFNKKYMLSFSETTCEIDLKDIENLITHLEYFKNNDSLQSLEIKVGGRD